MPRSYRGIIIAAICGLVFVCLGTGAYYGALTSAHDPQPQAEPARTETSARIGDRTPSRAPVPVEVVNQPAEPQGYQDPCRYDESDRRSDLCAQWTAARGASDAAWYARLQLWAAAAGMIGLLITIYLTNKAVKAAQRSVEVAQDTAKRQLRAYISAVDVEVRGLIAGEIPCYSIMIRNSGQTPAYRVRSVILVRGSQIGPDRYRIHRKTKGHPQPSELGPGQEIPHITVGNVAMTDEDMERIFDKSLTMIFAGAISYRDAFGKLHRTTFRRYVDPERSLSDEGFTALVECEKGNRAN